MRWGNTDLALCSRRKWTDGSEVIEKRSIRGSDRIFHKPIDQSAGWKVIRRQQEGADTRRFKIQVEN